MLSVLQMGYEIVVSYHYKTVALVCHLHVCKWVTTFLFWQVQCLDVSSGGLGVSCDTVGKLRIWQTDNGEVRVSQFVMPCSIWFFIGYIFCSLQFPLPAVNLNNHQSVFHNESCHLSIFLPARIVIWFFCLLNEIFFSK